MAGNITKRLLASVLTLAMLCSVVPPNVSAAVESTEKVKQIKLGETESVEDLGVMDQLEETGEAPETTPSKSEKKSPDTDEGSKSGTTGACIWTLNGTILTISGDGDMADYSNTGPWGTDITEVFIEDGVTTIGNCSFAECEKLTTVRIPESMRYIGLQSFYMCRNLTSVVIPNNVNHLYGLTFFGCSSLHTVVLPYEITIETQVFSMCKGLKYVYYDGPFALWNEHVKYGFSGVTVPYEVFCLREFTVYYKTETEHIFPVAYTHGLKVEPGSSFNGVDLDIPGVTVQVLSGPAGLARDGKNVEVNYGASGTITVAVYYKGSKIATYTFNAVDETNNLFAAGYGTEERPFLIEDATHFSNIRQKSDKHFMLIDDINLGKMTPIDSFSGTLDGAEFWLKYWDYSYSATGNMGIFKVNNGTIKNLRICDSKLLAIDGQNGSINTGMVCGTNNGTIDRVVVEFCEVSADMGAPGSECGSCTTHVGGICGVNLGTIRNSGSRFNDRITGYSASKSDEANVNSKVGGIAGHAKSFAVFENVFSYDNNINCYAMGDTYQGGFLWLVTKGAYCYANAGGIVGACDTIKMSYVLGFNNQVNRTYGGKGGEALGGCLIGYCSTDQTVVTYGYSENRDGSFYGRGAISSNSIMKKVERLCVDIGTYTVNGSNELIQIMGEFDRTIWTTNKGIYCTAHGCYGLPEIAEVSAVEISSTKTQYDQGEALNLNAITLNAVKLNTNPNVSEPVLRGYKITGYNPFVEGDGPVQQKVYVEWGGRNYADQVPNYFTVTVAPHEHSWITAATCSRGQECGVCGYISSETAPHTYNDLIISPGCERGGFTRHTCTGCGHLYEDAAVPALGHTLDFLGTCVNCGDVFETLRDFAVYVCDAETGKPVSGASVTMGGIKILTEADGAARYQISNEDARTLVISASGYPTYETDAFIPGQMPDTYIYLESSNTGIYEAWCNGDNVLLVESQVNCRAPAKEAKIVVKGRAQTTIKKYEIVQDGKVLASSNDGTFKIPNPYFRLDTPVSVRMYTEGRSGTDNVYERGLQIGVVGVSIDVKLDDLFPFIGGSGFTFDESAPFLFSSVGIDFPDLNKNDKSLALEISNERIVLTYGLEKDYLDKDNDDKTSRELFKEILKKFDQQNNPNYWPKGKKKSELTATAALIVEFNADGVTAVYGEIHIGYEFSYSWGKTFVVWVVPIYAGVDFKVGGELTVSDIGYDFENAQWKISDNEFHLYVELTAKGGLGCSLISAGVYGTAGGELILGMVDYTDYIKYRFYGELGLYVRVDPIFWQAIEYKLALITGEWYGPNGQVKLKREMLAPENYEVSDRSYLETRSTWNTVAKRGDTTGVLQTSSYTAIEPRIVQSGDTVMMLFMDDDGSQGYNYQHLYYSILDPATNNWKTPVRVDDSQFADIDYDVYADESGIYLAYCKIPEITEENCDDHLALLAGVEIYTAQFNGTGFVNHTNVSNNDCYDSQPQVTKDAVVWISNSTNDTLGENANNMLMLARKSNNWTSVVLNQNGPTVTSVDMGVLSGNTYVALIRDIDCDLTTDDRSLQLISLSGTVIDVPTADYTSEGVRFENVNGKGVLQWACAGNVWQLNSENGVPVALLTEANSAINDSFKYQQLGEGRGVLIYAQNGMNGTAAGSNIYGVYCVDGQWGQPLAITEHAEGMYVDAFDACYYKDKILLAYIHTEAIIDEDSVDRICNFVSTSIEPGNDLIAENASFLSNELFEGKMLEMRIPVTNGSWQNLQNITVQLQDDRGTVVFEQRVQLETKLASGESDIVILQLPKQVLTSDMQYRVVVCSADWTDDDPANNTIPLDLWYADFDVVAKQIIQGDKQQIQYAVTNNGNICGSAQLLIYDGKNANGTFNGRPVLYSQDITVDIGKSVSAMVPVTQTFMDKTVYVVVEPTTAEMYEFNNQQSVSVRDMERTTTNDITGTEQAVANPVFANPYIIYDRYAGGDVTAPATENGWTFTSIEGLDSFTYSGGVLSIPESYLKNADLGYHYYTLHYTMGNKTTEALLILEVRDHAPLSVENVTVEYDGAPVALSDLSYETPSTGAVSTRYKNSDSWIDGLPTNAGTYTVELSLAAEEDGFYTAAKQEFTLTITKAMRSLSAPNNIQRTKNGITFTGAVPDKEPTDGEITYGYSETMDPTTVEQWSATGFIAPTSSDITYYLYAKVIGSKNYKDAYSAAYITSGMDEWIEPVTGTLKISGSGVIGTTLTADVSDLKPTGATYSYVWQIDGETVSTEETYTVTAVQQTVTLTVTASNGYSGIFTATIQTDYATQEAPSAPVVNQFTATSVMLRSAKGMEYSMDGVQWKDYGTFTGLSPNTTYYFYARRKATDTAYASPASVAVKVVTPKLNPKDPPKLNVQETTCYSITLVAVEGMEYKLLGGAWTDSNVFTGLQPDTSYWFCQRYKETDTTYASDVVEGTFKTAPLPDIIGAVIITGTPGFGKTLQVEADVDAETLTYLWYRDNTLISGATGSTYTVTEADMDTTLRVVVSAPDVYSGSISVYKYIPPFNYGDVNDDGKINGTDISLIRRYIAGGYGVKIIVAAADINGDGLINGTDVSLLRRYIAGGWGVTLPK